mmetsp:Transcript_23941/g.33489  ORF Transcript_23941/g.33489 Transcript_23941/m.33489 type:complete len:110 (-) Transcript_23941:612-941(-)
MRPTFPYALYMFCRNGEVHPLTHPVSISSVHGWVYNCINESLLFSVYHPHFLIKRRFPIVSSSMDFMGRIENIFQHFNDLFNYSFGEHAGEGQVQFKHNKIYCGVLMRV